MLGCSEVRGARIAFLVPNHGVAILASERFPGGQEVGSFERGRLLFSLPGLGRHELAAPDMPSGPAWGQLDRSFDGGAQRGCFGFGARPFSSSDDFLTYVHWFLGEVLLKVAAVADNEASSLRLGERQVTLEVSSPNQKPLRVQGTEGSTLGFRLAGSSAIFLAQPFILDQDRGRIWLRVWQKDGPYFGAGSPEAVGEVVVSGEEATSVPAELPLSFRLLEVTVPP